MIKLIIGLLVIIFTYSCGDGPTNKACTLMKNFMPDEIGGWKLNDAIQQYNRQTIFDYIDGAGEVYCSYDFNIVSVFKYTKQDSPDIEVEIFDMGTDADAFGVFSYARESELHGIGNAYEHIGSIICFWQSRYYVCVRAEDKTDETQKIIFEFAKMIDKSLPQSKGLPGIISYLPKENLKVASIRYLRSYSALNYHYYFDSENIFNIESDNDIALAEYAETPDFYLLIVKYKSDSKASQIYNSFIDRYSDSIDPEGVISIGSNRLIMIDAVKNCLVLTLDIGNSKTAKKYIDECKSLIESY